jgi:hypothetical protein
MLRPSTIETRPLKEAEAPIRALENHTDVPQGLRSRVTILSGRADVMAVHFVVQ